MSIQPAHGSSARALRVHAHAGRGSKLAAKSIVAEHLEHRIVLSAYTFHTLATFAPSAGQPTYPGSLVMDSAGDLFGANSAGGANSSGVVFEIPHGGSLTTVASFPATVGNGAEPTNVLLDASGDIYVGSAFCGPNNLGSVFEIAHGTNALTTVATFNSAVNSPVALAMDASGNLFGESAGASSPTDFGSVFEIARGSSVVNVLVQFNGKGNGGYPAGAQTVNGGLTVDSKGNLFGVTTYGTPGNAGSAFEIVKGSKTVTLLASSPYNTPYTSDAAGNVFYTSERGGAYGYGTVDELVDGKQPVKTLISFNGKDGSDPITHLIADANGNIYGTTSGYGRFTGSGNGGTGGTLFELCPPPMITGFTLINADTGKTIETLQNGATLHLSTLPKDLNIVVNTTGGIINSVLIGFDKNSRFSLSNDAPYTLFGYKNGHYLSQIFAVGQHTLTATAWSELNAKILAARSPALVFNVIAK